MIICPYCNKPAEWVENKEVYGRNYGASYMIYLCRSCNAYVGCHHNSIVPKGTLANAELRAWRIAAHSHIDPIWKSGTLTRKNMYRALKAIFGYEVHIGYADIQTCKKICELSLEELKT